MSARSTRRAGCAVLRFAAVALLAAACASAPAGQDAAGSAAVTSTPTTTTEPASTAPTTTSPATTTAPATPAAPTTTTTAPIVHFAFPVQPVGKTGYGEDHHDYPATDIFNDCGATVVSPVDGVVADLRRDDPWVASVDDPWTRGGRYVAILGNDGVRYYLAHFQHIDDDLEVGTPISAGTPIAELGRSGRAGACHVHIGISPPCPEPEWWVRRGVVWPFPYLDDWKQGGDLSPALEVSAWSADHPDACTSDPGLS